MSEVGVLQWLEEHHIPVDLIAGTSMGCMVSALYSTGKSVDQLKAIMTDEVFTSVFSFNSTYASRSFRRREDTRALPNGITVGLKHGISLRNAVLIDQGLNAFLDRQFLRYDDRTDFNTLPIPLRCLATDLNDAKTVTFSRGSLPDAVRASVSLPGVYPPVLLNGHQLVDGGVLENLPTRTIHSMQADVVLAVSLPLQPVATTDLNNILGVLQRSFAVAIEAEEQRSRSLANVVIEPDISGFTATDYLKTVDLAQRGYQAAELHKADLLPYAVTDQQWSEYLTHRASLLRGSPGSILHIRVQAPNSTVTHAVERKFQPLVNQPLNTAQIESLLSEIRSDGRYDADYSITYDSPTPEHPIVHVAVLDKKTGPPFLLLGANVELISGGDTRATFEGILLNQDLGGYGSELRSNFKLGFLTAFNSEYYRHLHDLGRTSGGIYLAPHFNYLRQPFYIYKNQARISERQLQHIGGGLDLAWTDQRLQELRLGWEAGQQRWNTQVGTGADGQPDISGPTQRARIRYTFDSQDRALIPQYGIRSTSEVGYLYNTIASPDAPFFTTQLSLAHQINKNIFVFNTEAGTMLNRNIAEPFRFTLGGPLRLSASAIDEYRGTDYFLVEPVFLHRIFQLPQPLGHSLYLATAYEAGQMHAPSQPTSTRQDLLFGLITETPIGIITIAPAIGDAGHHKLIFTLGKLF